MHTPPLLDELDELDDEDDELDDEDDELDDELDELDDDDELDELDDEDELDDDDEHAHVSNPLPSVLQTCTLISPPGQGQADCIPGTHASVTSTEEQAAAEPTTAVIAASNTPTRMAQP